MDPELDIFPVARDYLDGRLSLDDLQEWLVPRLGVFLADLNSTSSQLAGLLELTFADLAAGEADEDELRKLIEEFLRAHETIRLGTQTVTASTNEVVAAGPFVTGLASATGFSQIELLPVGR